jgi:hypothetical protein
MFERSQFINKFINIPLTLQDEFIKEYTPESQPKNYIQFFQQWSSIHNEDITLQKQQEEDSTLSKNIQEIDLSSKQIILDIIKNLSKYIEENKIQIQYPIYIKSQTPIHEIEKIVGDKNYNINSDNPLYTKLFVNKEDYNDIKEELKKNEIQVLEEEPFFSDLISQISQDTDKQKEIYKIVAESYIFLANQILQSSDPNYSENLSIFELSNKITEKEKQYSTQLDSLSIQNIKDMNRDELLTKATDLGIQNPEYLSNRILVSLILFSLIQKSKKQKSKPLEPLVSPKKYKSKITEEHHDKEIRKLLEQDNLKDIHIQIAKNYLSKSLLKIAPWVKDYNEDSLYINTAIKSILDKNSYLPIETLYTTVANLIAYINLDNCVIFRKRLQAEYYLPEVLMYLSQQDKFPEIIDDTFSSKDDSIYIYDSYITSATNKLVREMAESLYKVLNPTITKPYNPQKELVLLKTKCENKDVPTENKITYTDPVDQKTYCFNSQELYIKFQQGDFINPYTGQQFNYNFIQTINDQEFNNKLDKCVNFNDVSNEPLENIIFYNDPYDNLLYCFSILKLSEMLKKSTTNPYTKREFTTEFLDDFNRKFSIVQHTKSLVEKNSTNQTSLLPEDIQIETDLIVPDLWELINEDLNRLEESKFKFNNKDEHDYEEVEHVEQVEEVNERKCVNCKISNVIFTSVVLESKKPNKISFCSTKCFENYKFPKYK